MGADSTAKTQPPQWVGSLTLGSGLAIYVGVGDSASAHRHSAIQLITSGSAMQLCVAQHNFKARTAVVPADVEHSFMANAGEVVILMLIELSGTLGKSLHRFALEHVGVDVSDGLPALSDPPLGPDERVAWGRAVVAELVGVSDPRAEGTHRPEVTQAKRWVVAHLDSVPRLTEVASHVGLSPRQLSRDFSKQVGMPFRRFVVWSRIRQAVLAVRDGHDLTNAAATAGFADSAHFSRVFHAMFGLQPSLVLPFISVAEADS